MMNNANRTLAKQKFEKEKEHYLSEIRKVRELNDLNEYLKTFNWALIHPYLQGAHIHFLQELAKTNSGTNDEIYKVFASSFFHLDSTALFIDGYFKKRPCLEPFCPLIDQSVILCLQKDYAGAINILIPVIEGSLRHYLVNVINVPNRSIKKSDDLLKAFQHIKSHHLGRIKAYYGIEFGKESGGAVTLDTNQIERLTELKGEYLDLWFAIIKDYFTNSLYLTTDGKSHSDKLNRHSIFHALNGDIYYSLENYLKIYSCLHYLAWAFTFGYDNLHVLADIGYEEVKYKWKAFEKIKLISEILTPIKSAVYSKHPGFDKISFEKELIRTGMDNLIADSPAKTLEEKMRFVDWSISKVDIAVRPKEVKKLSPLKTWILKRAFNYILKIVMKYEKHS